LTKFIDGYMVGSKLDVTVVAGGKQGFRLGWQRSTITQGGQMCATLPHMDPRLVPERCSLALKLTAAWIPTLRQW